MRYLLLKAKFLLKAAGNSIPLSGWSRLSLYGSYSQSFTPNSGTTAIGKPLDPQQGSGYEFGIKADLLAKKLFATLAYFDSKHWIDLDLPDVINLRRQLDHETEQHRLIAQSALDFSWMDEIPDCLPENLLILAEGLLMYFTLEQVQQLIQQLRQRFPNATLMFEIVGGASKGKAAKVLTNLILDLYLNLLPSDMDKGGGVSLIFYSLNVTGKRGELPAKFLP
ncbi:MAG: TonB-dependent receptor domain-containing protein [Nostoc sp.]